MVNMQLVIPPKRNGGNGEDVRKGALRETGHNMQLLSSLSVANISGDSRKNKSQQNPRRIYTLSTIPRLM
jgi:hypothetical protein